MSVDYLNELEQTIIARKNIAEDKSYTASLLNKGVRKCAQKFGEEAFEFAIAAVSEEDENLQNEAADMLYHMLVVLAARDISLDQVMQSLEARKSQSGHAEKAARKK